MSEPQRLPRKYLSHLQQAQEDLRLLGQKARCVHERLGASPRHGAAIEATIRDIESAAYRIALQLAELKTMDDCNGCPLAPSSVPAQVHLLVLADELERQAALARQCAREESCHTNRQQAPTLLFTGVDHRNAKK